jgi:hypothetical protein
MSTIQGASNGVFKEVIFNSLEDHKLHKEICYGELFKEMYIKGFKIGVREVTYPKKGIMLDVCHPNFPLVSFPHYFSE